MIQKELRWAVEEARKPQGDRKGLQQVIIDLTGEVRKQLRFQVEIVRSLYDMRGVMDSKGGTRCHWGDRAGNTASHYPTTR